MEAVFLALARFRDRVRYAWPQNWPLTVAAFALALIGHWAVAAYGGPAASALASLWLLLAASALLLVTGRAVFQTAWALYAAGGLFVFVLFIGLVQLTPSGPGLSHPMWGLVDAAGAITLDRDATVREMFKLAALGGAFLTGMVVGRNDRRARLFYRMIVLGGLVMGLVAALDVWGVWMDAADDARALVFAAIALLALTRVGQVVRETVNRPAPVDDVIRSGAAPFVTFVLSAALTVMMGAPATIAALVGAALGLIAWELYGFRARSPWVMGAMGAFGVAAATTMVVFVWLLGPTVAAQSSLEGGRVVALQTHGGAILDAPVFGYGFGAFADINSVIKTAQNWRALEEMQTAQSVYVQWMLEGGLLATLAIGASIVLINALLAIGALRRKRLRSWLRATVAVSVLIVVQGVASDALQTWSTAALWAVLLGVAAGLATSRTGSSRAL